MAVYKETAVIVEKEIEKLNSFKKIDQYIRLSTYYHVNRCEKDDCTNCTFINKICYIYHENYTDKENEVMNLQNICRKHYGSFFTSTVFLKSLAAVEKKKQKLESKFNELLKIWNASTNI